MKKAKKAITVILSMLLIISAALLVYFQTRSPLEKAVRSCLDVYYPFWWLSSVKEDAEEKKIDIRFTYKEDMRTLEERRYSMKEIYEAVADVLLKNEESSYQDYSVDILFDDTPKRFGIRNITADGQSLGIYEYYIPMQLKKIAEYFPEARVLEMDMTHYDDIQEISGFSELEYVEFRCYLSEEEKAYIWSLYPDCVIKDLTPSND